MLSAAYRVSRARVFYVRLVSLTETNFSELKAKSGRRYAEPNLRESLCKNVSPVLSVVGRSVCGCDCRVGFTQPWTMWERGPGWETSALRKWCVPLPISAIKQGYHCCELAKTGRPNLSEKPFAYRWVGLCIFCNFTNEFHLTECYVFQRFLFLLF